MQSSKPAISLRRPPAAPPPTPEQVDAFVRGGAVAASLAAAGAKVIAIEQAATQFAPERQGTVSDHAAPLAVASVAPAVIEAAPSAPDAAPDKRSGIRSKLASVAQRDDRKLGTGIVRRESGVVRRRLSLYISPSVAKSLVMYAADHDEEMSNIVEAALVDYLERRK